MEIQHDFLFNSPIANKLYYDYVADLPIIDFHNHLLPEKIFANTSFDSVAELWLAEDHYKWRAMRIAGIDEKFITGQASDLEKFIQWSTVLPLSIMNPLFHWSYLELNRVFGWKSKLDSDNAVEVYDYCNHYIIANQLSPQKILNRFNCEVVCTTDHPSADLKPHQNITALNGVAVFPSFRPDDFLHIDLTNNFKNNIVILSTTTGREINTFDHLLEALSERIDYFDAAGCRIADHGLAFIPFLNPSSESAKKLFSDVIQGTSKLLLDEKSALNFKWVLLFELAKLYHKKKWSQQFHLGAFRRANTKVFNQIGDAVGTDTIGDDVQVRGIIGLLDALNSEDKLPKTILYNLNPAYNEAFAALTGNFFETGIKGKVQFGPAWWFLDNKKYIENHLNALCNFSLINCFVGMVTDSRSILSMVRHEYFRRILCNFVAEDVRKGNLPNDLNHLGSILKNICYFNAVNYFGFRK